MFGLATLASAANLTTKSPVSGVQKVIKLLDDLKKKVEAETAQGAKDAEAMENECIESIAGLEKDVTYGKEKVEELAATAENENAKADGYAVDVATLGPQIAKLQDELSVAKTIRSDENKVFNGEEAELVEASTMLTQAYSVLKRSLSGGVSLLQGPQEEMEKVVNALGMIVAAANVDPSGQKKIKSLLQMSTDDSLSLSLSQPQATVSAYESKSGGILDAIEDMQEKTAQQLSKLREVEMDKKHAYELLVQDLTNQVNTKEDMLAGAKQNEADSRAAAGAASASMAEVKDALSADETSLADTKTDCHTYADEWAARKSSAEQEAEVLQKAMDVLSGKFSLLQTSSSKTSFLKKNRNYDQREKVATLLRHLGHKFNSFAMLQAAAGAMDDPFVKVRGLIKDMIAQLETQAAEEASKEGKCKADIASGTRDVKVKAGQMKKYQSRLDGASAKYETLGTEVTELQTQVKQLGIDMQAWTKLRNQDNTDNSATIKDAKESIEAINTAIGVLQEFYGTAAFLQAQSKQPQGETATVIIEYLQTAQEDFEKILQTTETAEKTGKDGYEKDMQAGKVTLAKKNALIDGKTQERAGLKVMIGQVSEDLANATKAWEAATEYLKNKKEECSNKAMSYEERKRRREEEIAGLQEALEILSSDA